MHSEKIVGGDQDAAALGGLDDGGPVLVRDAPACSPLLDSPRLLTDLRRQCGRVNKQAKEGVEGSHMTVMTRDKLSRQQGTPSPLTITPRKRTICPMGSRAVTPKAFKESFCKRLRAARMLKYEQAADFAHHLGIPANTYGKYESGRSLLPHHLVPLACELLDIDVKTLFQPEYRAARKSATG